MRVRNRRGQTSADYLGGLLLVAMIIAAFVSTDVPSALAGDVKRLVCKIAGQECAATDDGGSPSSPTTAERPVDGPSPIPDGPLIVLPFPGSVSVKCSISRESEKACKAPPGIAVHTLEVKAERSATTLNAKGCPQQILSVGATLKLESTIAVGGAKVGGSLTRYEGVTNKYSVTVAPDQADAIEAGERGAPNPVDPRTIRPGESVQLSKEFFDGISGSAQYRGLQAQLGYDDGRRVSSGVTRVDDSTVRVYVGDEDFVRHALAVGIGVKGAKASIARGIELSEGKLHAIDIDISSPAGWSAYQQFVTTGTLPKSRTAGTSNAARSRATRVTESTTIEGELGPVKVGGILSDGNASIIDTTYPNGSGEQVAAGQVDGMGIEIVTRHDADGDPISQPRYALNFEGVSESTWDGFLLKTGRTTPLPPGGNVRMEFTPSDVDAMRQQGLAALVPWLQDEHDLSGDEIDDIRVTADGVMIGDRGPITVPSDAGHQIALALARTDRSPDEMLLELWRRGQRDPNNLISDLTQFADLVGRAHGDERAFPGSVRQPDCD